MKKNLTKKLMLSVLTLAFAVVSLGASTFAWFTLSGSVKVDQFQADVTGGYGLDIAVSAAGVTADDTYTWYTGSLPKSAILDIIGEEIKFQAVTPSAAVAGASTVYKNLEGTTINANEGYISFNLNFKMTDAASVQKDLYLKLDALKLTSDNKEGWVADIAYSSANGANAVVGETYTYDVLSAARFAITTSSAATVYEQAAGGDALVDNTEGFNQKGAVEYYNKKMNYIDAAGATVDGKTPIVAGTEKNTTVKLTNMTLDTTQYLELAKFDKYAVDGEGNVTSNTAQVVSVTVYVWIEGWDAECINAIFNQQLMVDMSFSIYNEDGTKAQ